MRLKNSVNHALSRVAKATQFVPSIENIIPLNGRLVILKEDHLVLLDNQFSSRPSQLLLPDDIVKNRKTIPSVISRFGLDSVSVLYEADNKEVQMAIISIISDDSIAVIDKLPYQRSNLEQECNKCQTYLEIEESKSISKHTTKEYSQLRIVSPDNYVVNCINDASIELIYGQQDNDPIKKDRYILDTSISLFDTGNIITYSYYSLPALNYQLQLYDQKTQVSSNSVALSESHDGVFATDSDSAFLYKAYMMNETHLNIEKVKSTEINNLEYRKSITMCIGQPYILKITTGHDASRGEINAQKVKDRDYLLVAFGSPTNELIEVVSINSGSGQEICRSHIISETSFSSFEIDAISTSMQHIFAVAWYNEYSDKSSPINVLRYQYIGEKGNCIKQSGIIYETDITQSLSYSIYVIDAYFTVLTCVTLDKYYTLILEKDKLWKPDAEVTNPKVFDIHRPQDLNINNVGNFVRDPQKDQPNCERAELQLSYLAQDWEDVLQVYQDSFLIIRKEGDYDQN